MSEDIYSVRLEDEVSGPAQKAATAMARVAVTTAALAAALRSGDAEQIAFARNANTLAGAELRAVKATQAAGAAVDRLKPKIVGVATAEKKAADNTRQFSYALNGLATAASNAAFNFAGRLARGLGDVAGSLWDTAELASRSRMSLGLLYGGMAEGQAAQAKALELSRKYGLSLDLVLATLNQFKGAGFDLGQSSALLQLGSDMRALGSTTEQLESVFLALRKIQSQTFLQGDELNMLSEAGVSVDKIYSRLEQKLGKTREEIIKMQSTRQLAAGDVLNAIAEATLITAGKTKFGAAGEEAANQTLGGLKDRLTSNLGADIFEATQRAEPALVKGMQSILGGALGANGTGFQDALTNALVKVGEGLEKLGPKLPSLIENLGRVADKLELIVDRLINPEKGFAAVGRLGFSEDSLPGQVLGLNGDKIGAFFGELWRSATQGQNNPYLRGQQFGQGFADGIESKAPAVAAAAAGVAAGAEAASKEQLQIKSPSRKMFAQGEFTAEGFALGIEDQADLAARAATTMAEDAAGASEMVLSPSAGATAAGASAGDTYSSSTGGARSVGDVHFSVTISGAGGADAVVERLRDFAEFELATLLERQLEGSGA